jgi:hypothetical protein
MRRILPEIVFGKVKELDQADALVCRQVVARVAEDVVSRRS